MNSSRESQEASGRRDTLGRIARIAYGAFATLSLLVVLWYVTYTASRSELWDFGVFYGSAEAALHGQNIYGVYGQFHLPYWYFPWVAWFFVPFALLPLGAAKIVFIALSLMSSLALVFVAGPFLGTQHSLSSNIMIWAMTLLSSWLLFRVGQADFILAVLIVWIIFLIERSRTTLAGALFPILLFKPHLLLVFIPFALLRGGRKFASAAFLSVLLVGLLSIIVMPSWPLDMIAMLRTSGQRIDNAWGFMTLPELIGHQENWSGTANLPITLGLFALALGVSAKYRVLPTVPFLSLTLAASLFCAPRAYSYNLPIIIPVLLWLSPANGALTSLLWLAVGLGSLASEFSTAAYLIVLAVFGLAIFRAERLRRSRDLAPT